MKLRLASDLWQFFCPNLLSCVIVGMSYHTQPSHPLLIQGFVMFCRLTDLELKSSSDHPVPVSQAAGTVGANHCVWLEFTPPPSSFEI